ncbi:MAG: hypothetical protein DLM57_08900, partial [Pseudonocardiales bacterium]
ILLTTSNDGSAIGCNLLLTNWLARICVHVLVDRIGGRDASHVESAKLASRCWRHPAARRVARVVKGSGL